MVSTKEKSEDLGAACEQVDAKEGRDADGVDPKCVESNASEASVELPSEAEEEDRDVGQPQKDTTEPKRQPVDPEMEVKNKISSMEEQLKEERDRYLRAVAELENFRKRATKERSELLKYAGENLARDLLEVVDNLELAAAQKPEAGAEEVIKGVGIVLEQFVNILKKHQITFGSYQGRPFDPSVNDALALVPSSDYVAGTVIQELKKAYFFKEKLLRPGQVVVSAAHEPAAVSSQAQALEEG